jgi:hypothetical protein
MCAAAIMNEEHKLQVIETIYANRFASPEPALDLLKGNLK